MCRKMRKYGNLDSHDCVSSSSTIIISILLPLNVFHVSESSMSRPCVASPSFYLVQKVGGASLYLTERPLIALHLART